jgi:hypothetical protein
MAVIAWKKEEERKVPRLSYKLFFEDAEDEK